MTISISSVPDSKDYEAQHMQASSCNYETIKRYWHHRFSEVNIDSLVAVQQYMTWRYRFEGLWGTNDNILITFSSNYIPQLEILYRKHFGLLLILVTNIL